MRNSEWKKTLTRAQKVEREILKWVKENIDKNARIIEGYHSEYDIECKKLGNIEIKEDRLAHQTDNYAIEYENPMGESSGIAITTAKMFVIVDWEYVIFIPTESLKYLIRNEFKRDVSMGWERQTKGWLIPRKAILNSPFADVKERWFPIYK